MSDNFHIYYNITPEINETVLITFTKMNKTHIEGTLHDYNYNAIMSYNDATKKKKVYCWKKIIPLNKMMLAKVEDIVNHSFVQVSTAYNNTEIELHKQLKPFNDNKILISIIKKVCHKLTLDFNEFWINIIHSIDKQRKTIDDDENKDNLLEYFKTNKELLQNLLKSKYENFNEILVCINDNIQINNYKITSKIGLISINGINNTKKVLTEFLNEQKWNFIFKYDSAPFYILESYTTNTTEENHQEFIQSLEEKLKQNKIFSKIEFIGKI